jgi:hypothetical protein
MLSLNLSNLASSAVILTSIGKSTIAAAGVLLTHCNQIFSALLFQPLT